MTYAAVALGGVAVGVLGMAGYVMWSFRDLFR